MKRLFLLIIIVLISLILQQVVNAVIEEDWGSYTRIEESRRDSTGDKVTLSWLKRSYTDNNENYTVYAKDFDPEGSVVLSVTYKGRNETAILQGEWNTDRKGMTVVTGPLEMFNKTMIITTNKIGAPLGSNACCPEVEINIDLIRPELYLELDEEDEDPVSYRLDEEIPVGMNITNYGDAETTNTVVYIDSDGLMFENGYPFYQLPTLVGKNQKGLPGINNQTLKLKLKFPIPPKKLNYSVHAYVKGIKGGGTYYYDAVMNVTLLPSVELYKSVTEESMMLSRKELESVYPFLDSEELSRWIKGEEIYVTLGARNYQNYEIKGIKMNDTVGSQFTAENGPLNWTFDLKPYETKEFRYKLKARRPGNLSIPPALLTYSEFNMTWNSYSNSPSTEVHGPCVQVFKKADKAVLVRGENATITINIRNSGDMPSKIKIIDPLPENSTFLGGRTYYDGVISPKESAVISYIVSFDKEGQMELPNPGIYMNGRSYTGCGEPMSSKILVRAPPVPAPERTVQLPVKAPTPAATPSETPQEVPLSERYRWLEGVIPALMLVFAVTILLILHRSTK